MAQGCETSEASVRPRPPLLRALGRDEPPGEVDIDGQRYRLVRVVKHDSWAATAFYAWRPGVLGPLLAGLAVYMPLHVGLGW
jgi:hypothetical protein